MSYVVGFPKSDIFALTSKRLLYSKLIQVLFPWSSTLALKKCRWSDSTSAARLYLRFGINFCSYPTRSSSREPRNIAHRCAKASASCLRSLRVWYFSDSPRLFKFHELILQTDLLQITFEKLKLCQKCFIHSNMVAGFQRQQLILFRKFRKDLISL